MTQEEKDAQATSDEQQGINVQDIVSKTGDLDTDAIQQ